MDVGYGGANQTYAIFLTFIMIFLIAMYVYYYKNLSDWVNYILILAFYIYVIGFFIYSIIEADFGKHQTVGDILERRNRSFYRSTVVTYTIGVIFVVINYFLLKFVKFNRNYFIVWNVLFFMIVVFFVDRIIVLDDGYDKLVEDPWGGIWYGIQSYATGSFLRFILITFFLIFASFVFMDLFYTKIKHYEKKLGSYSLVNAINPNFYNLFLTFSISLFLFIFVNEVKFSWIYPVDQIVPTSAFIIYTLVFLTGAAFVMLGERREKYFVASIFLMGIMLFLNIANPPVGYNPIDEVNDAYFYRINPGYIGIVILAIIFISFIVITKMKKFIH
jgi:hypothetical protein